MKERIAMRSPVMAWGIAAGAFIVVIIAALVAASASPSGFAQTSCVLGGPDACAGVLQALAVRVGAIIAAIAALLVGIGFVLAALTLRAQPSREA
jgi:hypothetical protein